MKDEKLLKNILKQHNSQNEETKLTVQHYYCDSRFLKFSSQGIYLPFDQTRACIMAMSKVEETEPGGLSRSSKKAFTIFFFIGQLYAYSLHYILRIWDKKMVNWWQRKNKRAQKTKLTNKF